MGVIEMRSGDLFHTVTSFTIALWNLSFLRDMVRLEKAVGNNRKRLRILERRRKSNAQSI